MNKESAFEWNLNFHKLEHEFIAKKMQSLEVGLLSFSIFFHFLLQFLFNKKKNVSWRFVNIFVCINDVNQTKTANHFADSRWIYKAHKL